MKRYLLVVLTLLMTAVSAFGAGPLRVYVGEFNAVGVQGKDDIKSALQSLLASRLSNDKLLAVATAAEAELLVSGTYISIGKQYNIDAVAKSVGGQTITRTFVQGEGGQDALFAAVGSLTQKLSADIEGKLASNSIPRMAPVVAAMPVTTPKVGSSDIIRSATVTEGVNIQRVPQGDIIRPQAFYRGAPKQGEIKRLDGAYNLMAVGEADATGKRLLFMAQNQSVAVLREGETKPISGFGVRANEKVVGLDYVDADGDGKPELYVTMMSSGEVESQVWELKNNRLVKVAEKIPYFFRAIALAGGPLKLYAQEQGRDDEQYYGDVYEVARQGAKIIKKTRIKMPRFGNVNSFNQFKHESGELLTVVYHDHNYLVVYDKDQKELWRSNDSFGGSELYYNIEDLDGVWRTGDKNRWYFLNQRIFVTSKQEVLVGKNDGFFVVGNVRMFKRGAVYSLYWNGAALEEVWRTKDTQNYMPDFYFDEVKSELLLLQLTQREDVLMRAKGATALQIKKVE
ncbi:MAG: VCBS repeat-containing protein [Trichlorobacter sp.]|uniref:VCBS repeat-containing protein n=1 Tax=Trichlorobacter sp. TaxID=2911007 RepID=UPI00256A69CD|nr:VCBS repeat-containing protein [Trichlorobacter sp.]MDK9719500.1 VCBS repeat-containing protein [Trichlorobacter sp.]